MDAAQRLKDAGYRLTPQRRVVWQTLLAAERHLTAEEIHERASRQAPELNLASVYRTLTLLGTLGLAHQARLGDGRGHWEPAHTDDVFHLVCRRCRQVTHHAGKVVQDVRAHLRQDHGFVCEGVELVVHGLCAACGGAACGGAPNGGGQSRPRRAPSSEPGVG